MKLQNVISYLQCYYIDYDEYVLIDTEWEINLAFYKKIQTFCTQNSTMPI